MFGRSAEQGDFQCKRCYSISGDPFDLIMLGKKNRKKEISFCSNATCLLHQRVLETLMRNKAIEMHVCKLSICLEKLK